MGRVFLNLAPLFCNQWRKIMNDFLEYVDGTFILINSLYSFKRVLIGVCAATIVGVTVGLLRSSLPIYVKGNRVVKLFFDAPRFPPPIAWIPFVIIAFGIGEFSAYTIVFVGAFFPIFVNAYEGAERVPVTIRNIAHSMEIRGLRYVWKVVFPATLPQIFTGVRIGMGMGWMSVIAAEMVSGQSGLGYSIQLNRLNLQYDLVILDFVLIGIIGFILNEGVLYLERVIIPWNDRTVT